MQLIADPLCPRCQAAVSLKELYEEGPTNRGNLLIGKIGIACPSCGTKLRVLQLRIVVGWVLGMACTIAVIWGFPFPHGNVSLLILALVCGWMFPYLHYTYKFAELRLVEDREEVLFPLENKEDEELPDDEPVDMALLSQVAAATQANTGPARSWICSNCKEENPGEFDTCWKCQTERKR